MNDRPQLSRESIVEAAIGFVDEHGLAALSMRQLGQTLGVEAMSLYYHVNGREDLLEGMVSALVGQVRVPPLNRLGPTDGWQTFLQQVAHAVRRLAVEHPLLFPLVATRPPSAPWLRPPLRSLRLVEDFFTGLRERGVDDEHAVLVYKTFTGFLLGNLLLEVAERSGASIATNESLDEGDATVGGPDSRLSLDDYPNLQRLRRPLSRHDPDAEFERGLEMLLDRLDTDLSQ